MLKREFQEAFAHADLPTDFESPERCEYLRLQALAADGRRGSLGLKPMLPATCEADNPCLAVACPICTRRERVRLLRFAHRERLHERDWFFVTVYLAGWTIAPGDSRPFGALRDHPIVSQLLQRIRRYAHGSVLLIGGVETVYLVVGNKPWGKPFHLHFMISGIDRADLKAALEGLPLDPKASRPIKIERVNPGQPDFIRALSYVLKQPLWRLSKRAHGMSGKRQWPSTDQLVELVGNLGAHRVHDRLFMIGIKREHGRFRMLQR